VLVFVFVVFATPAAVTMEPTPTPTLLAGGGGPPVLVLVFVVVICWFGCAACASPLLPPPAAVAPAAAPAVVADTPVGTAAVSLQEFLVENMFVSVVVGYVRRCVPFRASE